MDGGLDEPMPVLRRDLRDALAADDVGSVGRPLVPNALRHAVRVLMNVVLAGSLLVSLLLFAGATLPALFGYRTMVVTSGSMEPRIHVGDAVIIRPEPPENIHPGDVIAFSLPGGRGMVTHRVVSSRDIDGVTYFQTQGDANATPDANLTPAGAVQGRLVLTLPTWGYVLSYVRQGWALLFLTVVPMGIIMVREGQDLIRSGKIRLVSRATRSDSGDA